MSAGAPSCRPTVAYTSESYGRFQGWSGEKQIARPEHGPPVPDQNRPCHFTGNRLRRFLVYPNKSIVVPKLNSRISLIAPAATPRAVSNGEPGSTSPTEPS